nr:SDR family oxidoreductase [Burkholderiales bacterium]
DILVNNAGIQHVAPVETFPLEQWHRILAVDLTCAFLTTRALLPAMRAQRWGRIVNTCSVHALVGSPLKAAYTAAKHGLAGLTKVVALEAAADGVTCNGFCPGWTRTPILDQQIALRATRLGGDADAAAADLLREKQPSLAFVEPADLGEIVAFLCSPAAAQITGVILPVDGGWTAQ